MPQSIIDHATLVYSHKKARKRAEAQLKRRIADMERVGAGNTAMKKKAALAKLQKRIKDLDG